MILVGKDSPSTFDTTPERLQKEGNGLEVATRKYRMAAYLWQAFTAEQMYRNGFGRRCFRFEEEWQTGSLTYRDKETGVMRNEAKIHIVRSSKTVAELQDLEFAQQYEPAKQKMELWPIAYGDIRQYFKPAEGQKIYASVLLLDAHWDTQAKTIRGHAALGGDTDDLAMGIFGSHALQSYPSSIEEVVPVFSDCTRTNTAHVANDCNESGSTWEAANIGIGAHLHETGHLFGCPHQESGVMSRDYTRLNRTFTSREPYSTRTKSPGLRLCLQSDECSWHRLDTLRFKKHPCFQIPSDVPLPLEDSVHVWAVEGGKVLVTTPTTGIGFIEIFTEGDEFCHAWIEYGTIDGGTSGTIPRQVSLTESELRGRLPENQRKKKMKLQIHTAGHAQQTIEDFGQLSSKNAIVKLSNGQNGFRSGKVGESKQEGSRPEEIILESAVIQTKLLVSIKVYHGLAVDGLEFCYEDSTSQMFGKRGGTSGGSEFLFDTRRGEILLGFYLRAGFWIDGLEILTSSGRRSGVYGNPKGGFGYVSLRPP